ncbi:hypothetical protein P7C70_g2840, partial [Phenoliferia sp. Uapishka_3]
MRRESFNPADLFPPSDSRPASVLASSLALVGPLPASSLLHLALNHLRSHRPDNSSDDGVEKQIAHERGSAHVLVLSSSRTGWRDALVKERDSALFGDETEPDVADLLEKIEFKYLSTSSHLRYFLATAYTHASLPAPYNAFTTANPKLKVDPSYLPIAPTLVVLHNPSDYLAEEGKSNQASAIDLPIIPPHRETHRRREAEGAGASQNRVGLTRVLAYFFDYCGQTTRGLLAPPNNHFLCLRLNCAAATSRAGESTLQYAVRGSTCSCYPPHPTATFCLDPSPPSKSPQKYCAHSSPFHSLPSRSRPVMPGLPSHAGVAYPPFPFPEDLECHPLVVVDYDILRAGSQEEIDKLYAAVTSLGFFYLKNHHVDPEPVFEMGEETFALPMEELMKFEQGDSGMSAGFKKAGLTNVDAAGNVDTVYFINLAKDDVLHFPEVRQRTYPSTCIERMDDVYEFVDRSDQVLLNLMISLEPKLGLPTGTFARLHPRDKNSGSECRIISKPAAGEINFLAEGDGGKAASIGSHTDFGSFSMLHGRGTGGLQVLPPGTDQWQYIRPMSGMAICNVGDTLCTHTFGDSTDKGNNAYNSSKHLQRYSLEACCAPLSHWIDGKFSLLTSTAASSRSNICDTGAGLSAEPIVAPYLSPLFPQLFGATVSHMHATAPTLLLSLLLGAGAISAAEPISLQSRAKGAVQQTNGTFHRLRFLNEAQQLSKKYSFIHDLLHGGIPILDRQRETKRDLIVDPLLGVLGGIINPAPLPEVHTYTYGEASATGTTSKMATVVRSTSVAAAAPTKPTANSIATAGTPFFDSLIAAGALTENLFTFYMKHLAKTGSILTLGAVPTNHYTGDIVYTPVTSETYWEVAMSSVEVSGTAIPSSSVGAAIADSSSSSIFYQYPCKDKPVISLVFEGVSYKIADDDLNFGTATGSSTMCVGGVVGQDMTGADGRLIAIVGGKFISAPSRCSLSSDD